MKNQMETIRGNIYQITTRLMNLSPEDKQKTFELSEYKEKRSLSQNAYFWKLCSLLADKLNLSKEEVHFQMLKDYGQRQIIPIPEKIDATGLFDYFEETGFTEYKNAKFKIYSVYKPSHKMNTEEMRILLQGVIQECENVGIPTMSEEEIERLKLI